MGLALALVGCDELGLPDVFSSSDCPQTGNGLIDYDPGNPCVFGICTGNVSSMRWTDVKERFDDALGKPVCVPEDPEYPWNVRCTYEGGDSVRIALDRKTLEPDVDSDVFDVQYVLRSPDVQTPDGLAAGVDLECFERSIGSEGTLWFWDYDGGYLEWFPDRLEGSIGWTE